MLGGCRALNARLASGASKDSGDACDHRGSEYPSEQHDEPRDPLAHSGCGVGLLLSEIKNRQQDVERVDDRLKSWTRGAVDGVRRVGGEVDGRDDNENSKPGKGASWSVAVADGGVLYISPYLCWWVQ